MLDNELRAAGLDRRDAHVTNAILCDPEGNDKMLEAAIPCCAPRLARELGELPREMPILSLGAGASRFTIGKSGIQKYRGFVWTAPEIKKSQLQNAKRLYEKRVGIIASNKRGEKKKASKEKVRKALDSWEMLKAREAITGRTIMPTIHPAAILRGADSFLPVMRVDLRRLKKLIDGTLKLEGEGPFEQTADPRRAAQLLKRLGDIVTVDIETDNVDPMRCAITCVGIADVKDPNKVVIIDPWDDAKHSKVLAAALKHRTAVTHNGPAFDVVALKLRGVEFGKNEDTLVAHRTMFSNMPQSLAHVASVYCDAEPWKLKFKSAEEKGAVAGFGVSKEDLAKYNAYDVRLDALAWTRMQKELARERELYEEDMRMAELYTRMQMTGIRVDVERRAQLSKKLRFRARALVGEMRQLLHRRGFMPSKPNDIRKALFGQLKAPIWLAPPTPTGLPSTAAIVLEALREQETRAGKLADYLVRWRSANDSRSEYLDGIHVHNDGRIHPTWKQVETGRPATRSPNVLNLPRMSFCKGCGVKLVDGCVHGKKKIIDGVETFIPCKKKQEPQPEDQLRDVYVASEGHEFAYFDLCFAAGTEIDTPTGPVAIEKLSVGDLVYTYRKETRRPAIGKVNQKIRVGRAPVVKVTLDNGATVRCTGDHKWLVCPERQDDDPIELSAANLRPGDRLLPLRKLINRGSKKNPSNPREYLYAHKAIEYSVTHVEVALTAHGPRPPGHDVHHKNEKTLDNSADNLEYKRTFEHKSEHGKVVARKCWDTPKTRTKMTRGLRRAAANDPTWCVGEKNPRWGDRRRRRTRTCDTCGKTFEFFARDEAVRRFCSRKCYATGRTIGLNHKVVSVVPDGFASVWSIGVDPDRNYALAAGVFVKNCQAEMRFAAYISGDPVFMKSCEGDIHLENACILFPDGADKIRADPKGYGYDLRQIAKSMGFAVAYLAEAPTVFQRMHGQGYNVGMEEVEAMLDNLHTSYRVYYKYCEEQWKLACERGWMRIPFSNRIRWVGKFPKINQTANTPVQGGVAGVMNKRLLLLDQRRTKNAKLVYYWYDAAIYDTPKNEVADMEQIIREVWAEPIVVPHNQISFVQPIELKRGGRLSDF